MEKKKTFQNWTERSEYVKWISKLTKEIKEVKESKKLWHWNTEESMYVTENEKHLLMLETEKTSRWEWAAIEEGDYQRK